MKSDRISQLKSFLMEAPEDPFLHYALALEFIKSGTDEDVKNADEKFRFLLKNYPEYLATYYHAAALFARQGEYHEALQTYKNGISLATKQNSTTTLRELRNALQLLNDELE